MATKKELTPEQVAEAEAKAAEKQAAKEAKAAEAKAKREAAAAEKAKAKEEAAAKRKAEREAKAAEREAEKVRKAEEREKAKAEKLAEKERLKTEREANKMPEQNGIRRPKPGGKCASVWELCDQYNEALGRVPHSKEIVEKAVELGLNPAMARSNYAVWRKFNGITGRLPPIENTSEPASKKAATPEEAAAQA